MNKHTKNNIEVPLFINGKCKVVYASISFEELDTGDLDDLLNPAFYVSQKIDETDNLEEFDFNTVRDQLERICRILNKCIKFTIGEDLTLDGEKLYLSERYLNGTK